MTLVWNDYPEDLLPVEGGPEGVERSEHDSRPGVESASVDATLGQREEPAIHVDGVEAEDDAFEAPEEVLRPRGAREPHQPTKEERETHAWTHLLVHIGASIAAAAAWTHYFTSLRFRGPRKSQSS